MRRTEVSGGGEQWMSRQRRRGRRRDGGGCVRLKPTGNPRYVRFASAAISEREDAALLIWFFVAMRCRAADTLVGDQLKLRRRWTLGVNSGSALHSLLLGFRKFPISQ